MVSGNTIISAVARDTRIEDPFYQRRIDAAGRANGHDLRARYALIPTVAY